MVRAPYDPHVPRRSPAASLDALEGDKIPVSVPANARALSDSVELLAPVLAHGQPRVDVDEAPRRKRQVAAQEGGQVPLAHEAEAHGLWLGEHGQVAGQVLRGQLPDLDLGGATDVGKEKGILDDSECVSVYFCCTSEWQRIRWVPW